MAKKHHRDMTPEELKEYVRGLTTMPKEQKYQQMVKEFQKHGTGESFAIFLTNLQREKDMSE